MTKLLVTQASVDYYGFFNKPAFDFMGAGPVLIQGLFKAFEVHNLGLGHFKLEGDLSEPSTNGVLVRLGRFGLYRFKFDQIHATLTGFSDSDLEGMVSVIDSGDRWLRSESEGFAFKSHALLYSGHGTLLGTNSSEFLLGLPRRNTPDF